MSGYAAIESALKTLILGVTTDFKSGDVTLTDYRVLDSGTDNTHGTNKVVLMPGTLNSGMASTSVSERDWTVLVDLYTLYQDDSDWSDFKTVRDDLLRAIEIGYVLLTGILITAIVSDGDPAMIYDKAGSGPFFVTQRLRVTVHENVS